MLLILAGISIQMLTGDNGILQRVGQTKDKNVEEQLIEEARIDLMAVQTAKLSDSLTEIELENVLQPKYGTLSREEERTIDKKLTTKDGKYVIPVSKIYNGKLSEVIRWNIVSDANSNEIADVGDELKAGDEHFYVIKKEGGTLTLFSKYCLAKTTNESGKYYQQNISNSATKMKFSQSNYWKDEWNEASGFADKKINLNTWEATYNKTMPSTGTEAETLNNNALLRARKYGQDLGAIGRLLTFDEANTENASTCLFGSDSSDPLRKVLLARYEGDDSVVDGYLGYWLATTDSGFDNGIYRSEGSVWLYTSKHADSSTYFSVRPVVEIPESLIN